MHSKRLILFLLILVKASFSQSFDDAYPLKEEWRFPKAHVSGYVFDAELDSDGRLVIMFFKDGIKVIAPGSTADLAPYGQGPGDIERWAALAFDGPSLVDVEGTGKLQYFKKGPASYVYEKTGWLLYGNEFPSVKGAIYWQNKWFLAGFSNSDPQSKRVKGYYLSIFKEKGRPAKRLLLKDFQGAYDGPRLLGVHIRQKSDQLWLMLESEPTLYIFSCQGENLDNTIKIPMPDFYRSIRDYLPWIVKPRSKFIADYEDWLLSYSRIENFRVTETHLVIQLRTADEHLPRFAMLFYDLNSFALKDIYFTPHLFLTEKSGRYYFLENGDPGLDIGAQSLNILIHEKK